MIISRDHSVTHIEMTDQEALELIANLCQSLGSGREISSFTETSVTDHDLGMITITVKNQHTREPSSA